MNLYVEHDASTLARVAGVTVPHCDGLIVRHGRPDDVLAATIRRNPLADHWLIDLDLPGSRVVTWSGTLGDDLFEPHPMNWLRPGQEALAQFCEEISPQLQRHHWRICFQPHHQHVLSDARSSANLLDRYEGGLFEIALSPASMLAPRMMGDVEDHLTRIFQSLAARCAMVMLSDVRIEEDEVGEPAIELVPLGDGVLPRDRLLHLLHEHVPASVPRVIGPAKLEQQMEWLHA